MMTTALHADLLDSFGFGKAEIDVVIGDRKQEDIKRLKSVIDDHKITDQKEQEECQGRLLRIQGRIDQFKNAISLGSFDQFTQQKIVNLQSCYQILAETKNIKKNYLEIFTFFDLKNIVKLIKYKNRLIII